MLNIESARIRALLSIAVVASLIAVPASKPYCRVMSCGKSS
jgi:hypothetical protein